MANTGLYIFQIVISYGSALLSLAMYIVIIYFLLGPARKLAKATIAYLDSKKETTCACTEEETPLENTEDTSSEE